MNTTQQSTTVYPAYKHFLSHICWPSILGGVVVGTLIGLMLNLLGGGIGLLAFNPNNLDAAKSIGMTALIWMFAAGIISMFIAGWVTSVLSETIDSTKGYWQGFIMAGVTVGLMICIATSAVGSLVSGSASLLGNLTNAAGTLIGRGATAATQVATSLSGNSREDIVQKAKDALPSSLSPFIDQMSDDVDNFVESSNENVNTASSNSVIPNSAPSTDAQTSDAKARAYKKVTPALIHFIQSINTDSYDQERKNLINVLSQATGKSQQDIEAKINEWQNSYQAAKDKAAQMAKNAADKTAAVASHLAFMNFLIILASVIAGGIGGISGSRRVVVRPIATTTSL